MALIHSWHAYLGTIASGLKLVLEESEPQPTATVYGQTGA